MHAYCDSPDIVLVGNKSDMERQRVITEVRARNFAEKYNLAYVETSVLTGENVKQGKILIYTIIINFFHVMAMILSFMCKAFDLLLESVMNR